MVAASVTKIAAAGLEEIARDALETKAAILAAGTTKVAATKGTIAVDPIATSAAISSTKGISLGLGLGLGAWGPIILTGIIGFAGYKYWQYRKTHLEPETDEGFLAESLK